MALATSYDQLGPPAQDVYDNYPAQNSRLRFTPMGLLIKEGEGSGGKAGGASRVAALRQVLRHISEGLVAFLLERHDHAKPLIRSVVRELLCSCALRAAILFFNPYSLNRVRGLKRQGLAVQCMGSGSRTW